MLGRYIHGQLNTLIGVRTWINAFFANKEESTYYFMFSILGIYCTMPLLSLLTKNEHRKTLWFVVLLYFIFNSLVPDILGLIGITYNTNLSVLLGGYTIFVILGYLISTQDIDKKYRMIIYISTIIGLIYRYVTTFILSKEAGTVIKTTWGYTSWHSILLAVSIFLLIKNFNFEEKLKNNNTIIKILTKVSSCSFGIYLIHKIIMYYEKSIFNISANSWQWRTIGIITTYFITLFVVMLLKKIPIVRKIVP